MGDNVPHRHVDDANCAQHRGDEGPEGSLPPFAVDDVNQDGNPAKGDKNGSALEAKDAPIGRHLQVVYISKQSHEKQQPNPREKLRVEKTTGRHSKCWQQPHTHSSRDSVRTQRVTFSPQLCSVFTIKYYYSVSTTTAFR